MVLNTTALSSTEQKKVKRKQKLHNKNLYHTNIMKHLEV